MSPDPDEQPTQGPVVRDRRRIDPETGEVRERQETAAPAGPGMGGAAPGAGQTASQDALAAAKAEVAERTADLQRVQAEFVNYKRRVDRDRENARKNAVATTLSALLPVLDDIARAREHEELTGGFKAVAGAFERAVEKLGLTTFGAVGDEFDPRIHEALMHSYSDDVDGPTCQAILQVGYRMDDRILRAARVAVAEPSRPADPAPLADQAEPLDILGAEPGDETDDRPSYDDNGSSTDGGRETGA